MASIEIAPFKKSFLGQAVTLSAAESWPHAYSDWEMLADLSISNAAVRESRVVGTAFCTPFGTDVAMLNMIIVASSARGRGLGTRLMQTVLDQAGARETRLVATEIGLPLYRRFGFQNLGAIHQHQGVATPDCSISLICARKAVEADRDAISSIDEEHTHADRKTLIDFLMRHGEVRVLEKAAKVTAYGVCRKFGRGRVVGPVIAASSTQAKELINGFIAAYPEEFLRVDTPQASNLSPWLISVGLNVAGKGWSMRRSPRTPVPNTHALASQALG